MKAILADAIDKVVEEVLQNGESIIKIEGTPSTVAGHWEINKDGEEVIGIYLYVNGIEVFRTQDIGTRVYT